MAKTANVFVRVNPTIKEEAEKVLEGLGISLSTAVEMYLRQIMIQQCIPFELTLNKIEKAQNKKESSANSYFTEEDIKYWCDIDNIKIVAI